MLQAPSRDRLLTVSKCLQSLIMSIDFYKDTSILNFALTLEHLENTFYSGALAKFDEKAFEDAGFPSWVRGRFEQIASHEAIHVETLTKALGNQATQACQYNLYGTSSFLPVYNSPIILAHLTTSRALSLFRWLWRPSVLRRTWVLLR